jgi:hypothetical protein
MTTKEKQIQKLIKKAKEVKSVNIPEESILEVDLEAFYNSKGEIFYNNGVLYRKTENVPIGWLRLIISKESKEETPQKEEEQISTTQQENYRKLESWTHEFKKYVDNKFKTIKKEQEDTLKEIKDYIDLKLKQTGGKKK